MRSPIGGPKRHSVRSWGTVSSWPRARCRTVTEEHSQDFIPINCFGPCRFTRHGPTAVKGWVPPRNYSSAKLRVTAGSTGMPGPVVVETTTFFR